MWRNSLIVFDANVCMNLGSIASHNCPRLFGKSISRAENNWLTFVLWGIVDWHILVLLLFVRPHLVGWQSKCGQFFQYLQYAPRNWIRTHAVASTMCLSSLVACEKDPITWWRAMWVRVASDCVAHSGRRTQRSTPGIGLSLIELHFYGMVCLFMWEMQTRSQPLSFYWRLISSVGHMIECSLAQECEGERKGSGATNRPCWLCLSGSPLSTGIL